MDGSNHESKTIPSPLTHTPQASEKKTKKKGKKRQKRGKTSRTVIEEIINDKKKGTDEFLVEKKQPLTMTPNFEKLPLPNTTLDDQSDKEEKVSNLEKILKSDLIKTLKE